MMFCNMFLYVNNIFDSFCNKMINGRAAFLRRVLQIYDIAISNPSMCLDQDAISGFHCIVTVIVNIGYKTEEYDTCDTDPKRDSFSVRASEGLHLCIARLNPDGFNHEEIVIERDDGIDEGDQDKHI